MWETILDAVIYVLGLFGIGKAKSDVTIASETGQKLGVATAERDDAVKELQEIQTAKDARDSVIEHAAANPDSVRDDDGFATHS